MFRNLTAVALLLGAASAVLAVDKVHYQPRAAAKYQEFVAKKGDPIEGKIEKESSAGIEIKILKSGKKVTIPADDVLVVEYDVGTGKVSDFRSPLFKLETARTKTGNERTKILTAEQEKLRKLHKDVAGYTDAQRYVEFKIAEIQVMLAQDDPNDVNKRNEAIKLMAAFADKNGTAWTIVPALKTLARLQEEAGRTDDARATYEKLAGVNGAPKELKRESNILVGRLLLRGGKYEDAESRLSKLLEEMSDDEAQKPLVRAYLAEAKINQNKLSGVEKDLDGMIKGTSDGRLRGVAYNLLGDLYAKAGKTEDAFWAYLRVDALYNDDPDEQAKALYHLSELFTKIKKSDRARAEDCARRLRDKRFAGSPYQKRLIAEKGDQDKDKEEAKKDDKDKDKKKDKKR